MNSPIEEVVGPNVDRLVEIILGKDSLGLHFDWQPSAANLTPDQRAAEVLKWEHKIDEYAALPVEDKLRMQIQDTYVAIHECLEGGKIDVEKMVNDGYTTKELILKLTGIFGILDMQLLTLGSWVNPEVRKALYDKRTKQMSEEIDWGPPRGNEEW